MPDLGQLGGPIQAVRKRATEMADALIALGGDAHNRKDDLIAAGDELNRLLFEVDEKALASPEFVERLARARDRWVRLRESVLDD